jgi:hypothetical protein
MRQVGEGVSPALDAIRELYFIVSCMSRKIKYLLTLIHTIYLKYILFYLKMSSFSRFFFPVPGAGSSLFSAAMLTMFLV